MTLGIKAIGYHVGIVVNDIQKSISSFDNIFGGTFRIYQVDRRASTFDRSLGLDDSLLRIAYGRFGGMTLEFIEVIEGRGLHAQFLEEHGEGVQHLGFWVRDVTEATEAAVRAGSRLQSASRVSDGAEEAVAAVLSAPQSSNLVAPDLPAFLTSVIPSLSLEFTGQSTVNKLKTILGEVTEEIITLPPWAS